MQAAGRAQRRGRRPEPFLLPSLQTLEKDIEAGLKNEKDNIISADNTRLIKTIKSFVLQADKYELYKNFTNWSGTKFFDIPPKPEWDKIRDGYIKKLPPVEIASLERNIIKINSAGTILDGTLNTNNEEAKYLFSIDSNVKEYKDSQNQIYECYYLMATNLFNDKKYDDDIDKLIVLV